MDDDEVEVAFALLTERLQSVELGGRRELRRKRFYRLTYGLAILGMIYGTLLPTDHFEQSPDGRPPHAQ